MKKAINIADPKAETRATTTTGLILSFLGILGGIQTKGEREKGKKEIELK